jgi:hypothetical protein
VGNQIMGLENLTKEILLFVEGKDEISFFEAFMKFNGIKLNNINIIDVKGKNNFKESIPSLFKMSGIENVKKIAIIRDADEDAKSAFASIAGVLKKIGAKKSSEENKYLFKGKKIYVYIIPDNENNGMLETLCLRSVQDHSVMTCVKEFEKCLDKINVIPKNMEKTRSLLFLAAMPENVSSVGIGAKKGYWNFESKEFEKLKIFLEDLIK